MTINYLSVFIKIAFIIVICFVIIKAICVIYKRGYKIPEDNTINTNSSYVRIYYDPTTIPSLYQAYDFLNQSKEAISFVCWQRIPNLEKNLSSYKNVHVFNHYENSVWNAVDISPIKEFVLNNPDAKFIIHSSENWLNRILYIFDIIPKDAIKEVHLYEDSSYAMHVNINQTHKNEIANIRNTVLKDVKVFYHAREVSELNSLQCIYDKKCYMLKKSHRNDILTEASPERLKENLNKNESIKEAYFKIFNFNYKKFKEELKHPFGIFTFGRYWKDYFANLQIAFLNEITGGKLNYLVQKENVNWYYKEHPKMYDEPMFEEILNTERPDLKSIDRNIPMEMFILADIVPDCVAGYYSSMYFNIPAENISAYIKHPDDPYIKIFKRKHTIKPGRILELSDIYNDRKLFWSKMLVKIFR